LVVSEFYTPWAPFVWLLEHDSYTIIVTSARTPRGIDGRSLMCMVFGA
jgi:hypothetical protein